MKQRLTLILLFAASLCLAQTSTTLAKLRASSGTSATVNYRIGSVIYQPVPTDKVSTDDGVNIIVNKKGLRYYRLVPFQAVPKTLAKETLFGGSPFSVGTKAIMQNARVTLPPNYTGLIVFNSVGDTGRGVFVKGGQLGAMNITRTEGIEKASYVNWSVNDLYAHAKSGDILAYEKELATGEGQWVIESVGTTVTALWNSKPVYSFRVLGRELYRPGQVKFYGRWPARVDVEELPTKTAAGDIAKGEISLYDWGFVGSSTGGAFLNKGGNELTVDDISRFRVGQEIMTDVTGNRGAVTAPGGLWSPGNSTPTWMRYGDGPVFDRWHTYNAVLPKPFWGRIQAIVPLVNGRGKLVMDKACYDTATGLRVWVDNSEAWVSLVNSQPYYQSGVAPIRAVHTVIIPIDSFAASRIIYAKKIAGWRFRGVDSARSVLYVPKGWGGFWFQPDDDCTDMRYDNFTIAGNTLIESYGRFWRDGEVENFGGLYMPSRTKSSGVNFRNVLGGFVMNGSDCRADGWTFTHSTGQPAYRGQWSMLVGARDTLSNGVADLAQMGWFAETYGSIGATIFNVRGRNTCYSSNAGIGMLFENIQVVVSKYSIRYGMPPGNAIFDINTNNSYNQGMAGATLRNIRVHYEGRQTETGTTLQTPIIFQNTVTTGVLEGLTVTASREVMDDPELFLTAFASDSKSEAITAGNIQSTGRTKEGDAYGNGGRYSVLMHAGTIRNSTVGSLLLWPGVKQENVNVLKQFTQRAN